METGRALPLTPSLSYSNNWSCARDLVIPTIFVEVNMTMFLRMALVAHS